MDGHVKAEVGAAINALLAPMRERRAKMEAGPSAGDDLVRDVIAKGVKKANAVAEETLYLAKKAMGLEFGKRAFSW